MTSKKPISINSAYYDINCDYRRGGAPGWDFLNYRTLQGTALGLAPSPPWPDGYLNLPRGPWRFPEYLETPRFLVDKKLGRPPRDLENIDGFWIISTAMKTVLESVDPSACEFRPCETVLRSGEPGPERWICTVTRAFVGAVDEGASNSLKFMRGPDGLAAYARTPATQLKLIPEVVKGAHLFHIAEMAFDVFCDQVLKDACKEASLKGILFQPTI